MNTMNYRAFIKVVELGSITKAANELDYSQPGVSHMLNTLEDEVGFPLIIRSRDAIIPTEDGKKLLPYCQQIVRSEDAFYNTISSINGIMTGSIKIGAFNSLLISCIPQLVTRFAKLYPKVEIQLLEKAYLDMQTSLLNGSIDAAFTSDEIPKGFEFYHLFSVPVGVIMHCDHPLATYEKVPIQMLNGQELIMPGHGWDDIYNMVQEKQSFTPVAKHYVASDNAVFNMVSDDFGMYIISKLQLPQLPKNVVFREFKEDIQRNLGICVKSLKQSSPTLKEFVRFSIEFLSKEGKEDVSS